MIISENIKIKKDEWLDKKLNKKFVFSFIFFYFLFGSLLIHYIFNKNVGVFGDDSLVFHQLASKIADELVLGNINIFAEIKITDGFQFPAFFAGIIYYIFDYKNPNIILFFNVLFSTFSVFLFYCLFLRISKKKLESILFITPLLFFPSIFGIVSEISKGVFYLLGFSIFCFSFTIVGKFKYAIIICSLIILFFIRPNYFFYIPFIGDTIRDCFYEEQKDKIDNSSMDEFDQLAKTLYKIRMDKNSLDCKSNFDYNTLPKNKTELFQYIPTGFWIGFFKPYPNEWFASENKKNKLFWIISSFEMFFIYIGLFLVPFGLYNKRNKKTLIFITLMCFVIITAYGTISFNLGYLYRVRFIFLAVLTGIGYSYIPNLIKTKFKS